MCPWLEILATINVVSLLRQSKPASVVDEELMLCRDTAERSLQNDDRNVAGGVAMTVRAYNGYNTRDFVRDPAK